MATKQNHKITGVLRSISQRETKGNNFVTRQIILDVTDGAYVQNIPIQFTQDRCDLVDNFTEGQEVTISFNLRGRIWQDKCFGTIEGWRIESTNTSNAPAPPESQPQQTAASDKQGNLPENQLPF
jgi:hypothetical protein